MESPATPVPVKEELKLTPPESPSAQTSDQQASPSSPATPADLASIWQKFLQALKATHRNVQIKLTLAEPRSIEENKISVAFDRLGEVHVRQLQDREIQTTLEHVIKGVTGKPYRFHFFVDKNMAHQHENGGKVGLLADSEKADHPAVVKAMEVFNAELISRQDLPEDNV